MNRIVRTNCNKVVTLYEGLKTIRLTNGTYRRWALGNLKVLLEDVYVSPRTNRHIAVFRPQSGNVPVPGGHRLDPGDRIEIPVDALITAMFEPNARALISHIYGGNPFGEETLPQESGAVSALKGELLNPENYTDHALYGAF